MMRWLLGSLVVVWSVSGWANDAERFNLKGTITGDPRDEGSLGVAMMDDTRSSKTLVLRVGQKVPDSDLVLTEVNRKSVVLSKGNQRIILYRNAWEGNTVTSASEIRSERNLRRRNRLAGSNQKKAQQAVERFDDDDFRAPPPPPPPIMPPSEELDDEPNLEDFQGGDTYGGPGRIIYPDEDGELSEEIPGIYSDAY